ncbi:MAG: hypothetical protein F6K58_11450 [Symploca sp. SIO2E9]|nr:hypothetical protein [Symploca sp. SIO2E9]
MQTKDAITLNIPHLSTEGFMELCQANQDLQLENEAIFFNVYRNQKSASV